MHKTFPKLNLISSISDSKLNSNIPSMRLDKINTENKQNQKINKIDKTLGRLLRKN